jgi:RND family efflux transporter MFP subunit
MRVEGRTVRPDARSGRLRATGVGLLAVVGIATVAGADDPPAARREVIELKRCLVEYSHSSLLGSPMPGVLKECTVRAGERVSTGQTLGRLRDDDVVAEYELRKVSGESLLNIQLAQSRKELAETKLQRAKGISKRGYLSDADLKTAEIEAELARLDVETAKQQNAVARIQIRQAHAMIRFREFVSPHPGVVSEIFKTPGESLIPNTAVFRVVDDEQMRIVGRLDIVDAWRVRAGQAVRAWPSIPGVDLPVEHEIFEGRVIQVDSQIEPLTQTCKVVVEVENRANLLRAGLEARIEIDPTTATSPPTTAPKAREGAGTKPAEPRPQSKK